MKVKYEDTDHMGLTCQLGWLTVRGRIKLDLGFLCIRAKTTSCLKQPGNFIYQLKWFIHMKQDQLHVSGNVFLPRYELRFTQKSIALTVTHAGKKF